MSQSVILDCKGLHTYASPLSAAPSGSLSVALNININREGIAEPRRGFNILSHQLPGPTDRASRLVFWQDELFIHYGNTFGLYDNGSGILSRGTVAVPTNAQTIRAVPSQNKNLYVTGSTGLKKTDAVGTSLYTAGVPKGLTIDLALAGAGTAVLNTKWAAYKYHLGKKDANSNVTFGGVSGTFFVQNNAGSDQNVTATCYLPSGLDTTYFLRLYRTKGSASDTATGEEFQLCYEIPLSSTHISNGYVAISDICPDELLQGYLYTNPSQQGAVSDNAMPPLASDIAEYQGHLFFADVESPQRLAFTLISTGGTGLVATDTITISNGVTTETYTAHATTFNASIKQFVVSSSGSTTQKIDATIKSFIKCVNLASALVVAYSMSTGATDFPGKVMLEGRTIGSAAFTVVSTRSGAFQPQLTSPATVNNTSSADTYRNGLMYSKEGQPEAVPLKNLFKVGSSDDPIRRIVAIRDALLIFKERDGVWVLRGDNEKSFSVSLLDGTARLTAGNTIAGVNGLVYGLFESGIAEVTETGVTYVSDPVKDKVLQLFGAPLANMKELAFGFAVESEGKYVLSVPLAADDEVTTYQFVFDVFGRTFCEWDLRITCAGSNPADSKLYLGDGTAPQVKQERRAFDFTDYGDYQQTCTVASYVGTTLTIDGTADMEAGDVLIQGLTSFAYVESVDSANGTCVIDTEQDWNTAIADVQHFKAIDCRVGWNPDTGGNPAGLKQYYECQIICRQSFQKTATVYFSSDNNPSEAYITVQSASGNGAFGMFDFGQEVFGGEQSNAPARLGVPGGHARCSQLNVRVENRVAFSDFQITGLALSFNPTSTRVTR